MTNKALKRGVVTVAHHQSLHRRVNKIPIEHVQMVKSNVTYFGIQKST